VFAHSRRLWAAALALTVSVPAFGEEMTSIPPLKPSNQHVANVIAGRLRECEGIRNCNLSITYQNGIAELTGDVMDHAQWSKALRIVHDVPGVEIVRDNMTIAGTVRQVQAVNLPPQEQAPMPQSATPSAPIMDNGPIPPGAQVPMPEPVPIMQGPPPTPYDVNPPKMPGYAWPTYAPYNNYSRVAYPQLYPPNAWPYIGPLHPFPKVPPGWRKVQLEWQDGYWWYSTRGSSHDWWMLRYW
jgi:hypothetical protein